MKDHAEGIAAKSKFKVSMLNLWGCAIRHDESILRLTCSLGKIEG